MANCELIGDDKYTFPDCDRSNQMRPHRVAVFTPTYNRAYILPRLYQSLLRQTSKDFTWVIVDDGSTDETRELIQGYVDEGAIDIKYQWQKNGGKQRAHNTGITMCEEDLFFGLDSDDYLVDTAIEDIIHEWKKWENDPTIAGLLSLKGKDGSRPIGSDLPSDVVRVKVYDLYEKQGFTGDASMIYRVPVLKETPFIVDENEKFISESYIMLKIDDCYDLALLPKITSICEYLADGYSSSARKLARENPKGYMRVKRLYIDRATTFKEKVKNIALFLVGAFYAGEFKEQFRGLDDSAALYLAAPIALVLAVTEFRK